MTVKGFIRACGIGVTIFGTLLLIAAVADRLTSESSEAKSKRQMQDAAAQARRDVAAKAAQESAIATFSPQTFARMLRAVDISKRQKDWAAVARDLQARRSELEPITRN